MKKIILLVAVFTMFGFAAGAQSYIVVDSERIFKSLDSYNDAIKTLDELGQQYQTNVDDAFAQVEDMYNEYVAQRAYLTEAARTAREDAIIEREREINRFQEEVFGPEGELFQKRVELIKPIQDKVFQAIDKYAETRGYNLVLDIASNPMVLHYAPEVDRTEEIIRALK